MNCRGCRQSILVPRALRFLVTWSGNEGLQLVGYKLSRVALGTEMVGRGSFLFPTYLGRSNETLFAGYWSQPLPSVHDFSSSSSWMRF